MKKLTVTFCGHKYINNKPFLKSRLKHVILNIFKEHSDCFISFYCGGYGEFDSLARETVAEIRKEYGYDCEIIYVSPYLKFDSDFYKQLYDDTIFPPLESVPKRFAILRRNEWLVDNSDILIAYVEHHLGGSWKTLNYAQRRFKNHDSPKILLI